MKIADIGSRSSSYAAREMRRRGRPNMPVLQSSHLEAENQDRPWEGGLDEFDGFVVEEGRGLYRPAGCVTFDEAVTLVRAAIAAARHNQIRDLLVDTRALIGFPSPDTFQRYLAAVEWADEAFGRVYLAMVAREELIDPQKFGMTVAMNRGLVSNIFTTEAEARAWLDARRNQ